MLKITIHRNHNIAAREIEAGFEAGSLAEILSQANHRDARIGRADFGKNFERGVAAPVIDEHDFE